MKKKYKDSDFYLCGDDVNSESPKTMEVTCKLINRLPATGRSISSKLVISKNTFPNRLDFHLPPSTTLLLSNKVNAFHTKWCAI